MNIAKELIEHVKVGGFHPVDVILKTDVGCNKKRLPWLTLEGYFREGKYNLVDIRRGDIDTFIITENKKPVIKLARSVLRKLDDYYVPNIIDRNTEAELFNILTPDKYPFFDTRIGIYYFGYLIECFAAILDAETDIDLIQYYQIFAENTPYLLDKCRYLYFENERALKKLGKYVEKYPITRLKKTYIEICNKEDRTSIMDKLHIAFAIHLFHAIDITLNLAESDDTAKQKEFCTYAFKCITNSCYGLRKYMD